jgi:hypothetical protein
VRPKRWPVPRISTTWGFWVTIISQFRRYTPTFLEAFDFKAAPAAQKILDAIEVLKGLTTVHSVNLTWQTITGLTQWQRRISAAVNP